MKKILLALIFLLPLTSYGAIGFGGALGTKTFTNASTHAITGVSISGSDLVMICAVRTENISRTVSSVVWDNGSGGASQSFTQIGSYNDLEGTNHRLSLWALINPTTSNSRAIATLSSSDIASIACTYYNGVAQTSTFGTPISTVDTASGGSEVVSSDTNGSWAIGAVISANGSLTDGVGSEDRQDLGTGQDGTGNLIDSNTTIANGGSHTFNWTWGSGNAGWIVVLMRPVGASPILGCTDPEAENYDPEATEDDDSCTYPGGEEPGGTPFENMGDLAFMGTIIVFIMSIGMWMYVLSPAPRRT